MTRNFVALMSGLLFGFGLSLSEMINPQVVIGFLDITGSWNPALLFVMAGALLVSSIGFFFILKLPKPEADEKFHLPQSTLIDGPLLRGAVMFGIGWGLSGICPGPAIAAMALGVNQAYVFVVAMLLGMGLFELLSLKVNE